LRSGSQMRRWKKKMPLSTFLLKSESKSKSTSDSLVSIWTLFTTRMLLYKLTRVRPKLRNKNQRSVYRRRSKTSEQMQLKTKKSKTSKKCLTLAWGLKSQASTSNFQDTEGAWEKTKNIFQFRWKQVPKKPLNSAKIFMLTNSHTSGKMTGMLIKILSMKDREE
jgi:hypothetical protein